MATFAATVFDWRVDLPRNYAHNCSLYQGTTGVFSPHICSNGVEIAGLEFEGLYYQTNGMGNAWWRLDSLTFAPANDCGAAQYRFFIRHVSGADSSIHYDAQGILRMLPSPGFTPNAIAAPVATLDFAELEVLNAPWPDEADIADATNAVAQAARAYTDEAIAAIDVTETDPVWTAEKSGYLPRSGGTVTGTITFNVQSPGGHAWVGGSSASAHNGGFDVSQAGYSTGLRYYGIEHNGFEYLLPDYGGIFALAADIAAATNYTDSATNDVAQAARAYTDDAIAAIDLTESDPVWSAEKSQYATTNALDTSQRLVLALMQGTNVLAVVTNYNSLVNLPELSLKYLDGDNGYIEVWREGRRIEAATNALHQIEAAALATGLATKADAAWSRTTSGLGQEAPSNTTWISTATTVIAGGYEYAKTVTSNGEVFILTSNGMDLGFAQGSTNAFLSISAADGTPIFSIEKTDSYLVGVDPSAISVVGSACVISLPVVATSHPFARVATNLVNAVWSKEDENGMPAGSPATVSWSGTSGAYVATVDFGSSPQGYCYFEFLQEGMTKIVNAGATDLSGGIHFNGNIYYPEVSGDQLIFRR